MTYDSCDQLITGINIREFFHDSVSNAVVNQNITISGETILYIVNLLTTFTHTENFFDKTEDGLAIKPLALIYAESVNADSADSRDQSLQRLGDIALFISGLFSDNLNRKLVDIDYYIAMGMSAYANLAGTARGTSRRYFIAHVFDELSDKFINLVDALGEISDNAGLSSDSDIMHQYEIWLKTGSQRASRKLKKNGIHPIRVSINKH